MINDFTKQWIKTVAEFEQQLLLSLLPHPMDVTEAREFLKANNIQFLVLPDGRKELHGFGKKLGDVFCGTESHDPEKGIRLVAQFTPVAGCVAAWN